MRRILIISQYFYPETFRINDIAKELVNKGYRITVLTGIPNYPQGIYYTGYSKTRNLHEYWNGVEIIRLPIEPRRKGSLNLIINYFSFVFQGWLWVKKNLIEADAVFTYEVSPMTQALVGVWYAKKKNIPHILYVTDLWPENVEIITGIHNKVFLGCIQKMVDYIYKNSNTILTSSKSFIKVIRKRKKNSKIVFWPQYAEDFYRPVSRISDSEIPDDGILNLVFAGNIGYAQGLGILPKTAKLLKRDNVKIRFNLIGDGRYLPELKTMVDRFKVSEYFNFIDRKPSEVIPSYLAAADGLLITLSKSEVFSNTIPAKTQSCMACGRPLLVSADGEVQDIIKTANAGLVSDSEDVMGLVKNIKLLNSMGVTERDKFGVNALRYSERFFNKEELLIKLDTILQGEMENV